MRIAFLACLLAGIAGCAADVDQETVGDDEAPITAQNAHVIEAEPGVDVELRQDGLVFPAPLRADVAARTNGDVILSGRGAGFLRRIVGRHDEGDRVVVETAPAELGDAFEQMRLRGSLTDEGAEAARMATLSPATKHLTLPPLAIHDFHIPLANGSSVDIVEGLFELSPNIDVDLQVKRKSVERFKMTVGSEARGLLKIRYHLEKKDGDPSVRFKEDPKVASMPPKYLLFWIGGFPVVVAVHVDLEAGVAFAVTGDVGGEASLEANGSMTTGLEYAKGRFQDKSATSLSVKVGAGNTKLSSLGVSGEVTLTAKISLEFYDLAGPYVGLQAFTGVKLENQGKELDAFGELGIRGIVGARAGLFGKSISYDKQLFEKSIRTPN